MWTLAFDITTPYCNIALLKNKKTVDSFSQKMDFGQSEVLLVEIEKMLKCNNLKPAQLDLMAVCTGPGSFTGVRSGLAAAKSFNLALDNLTVLGVNAFDVYARQIQNPQNQELNVVLIETKRDDFYVGYYDKNLKAVLPYQTAFAEDVKAQIANKTVALAGNAVKRFENEAISANVRQTQNLEHLSVETLALIAVERFEKGLSSLLDPLYLKAADVCVK